MLKRDKRGMVLFIVLGVILVVVILSAVILKIVVSHSRLTHHQVSRIQTQYAAKAGMIFALEKLKTTGGWTFSPNSCPVATPCVLTETGFPASINSVSVVFCPAGQRISAESPYCTPPTGFAFCVTSTANFDYTP